MRVPGDIIAGTNGNDVEACWTERFNSSGQEAHTPGHYACLNKNIFSKELSGRESTKMPNRPYVTVQLDDDGRRQPDFKSASKAIKWMTDNHEKPFFLAVGLVRPYYPMVAPKALFEHYPLDQMPLPQQQTGDLDDIPAAGISNSRSEKNGLSDFPDNQRRMWSGYRASVEFIDQQVGRMLEALESMDLRDNTLVIFTSDHGYHLGEHTFWQKSNLHESVARVPLIVSVPKKLAPTPKSGRSDSLVELTDLYPTICEAMTVPVPEQCQGKSLMPVLQNHDAVLHESTLTIDGKSRKRHYLLRTKQWAFMRYHDGSRELYNMDEDPEQFLNLANDKQQAGVLEQLSDQLDNRLAGIETTLGR